jgi:c-di-GMP-binding flagellar brake protein YcgR
MRRRADSSVRVQHIETQPAPGAYTMKSLDHSILPPVLLPPPDRRRDPRHAIQVQIELREDGTDVPIRMNTSDLSRGGCYVELMTTLPVGTCVTATFLLNNQCVRAKGRVVTRHPQFGNGIQFLEFEGNGQNALAQYLDAIDAYSA